MVTRRSLRNASARFEDMICTYWMCWCVSGVKVKMLEQKNMNCPKRNVNLFDH